MTGTPLRNDPVWAEALDWLMRVRAAPTDTGLAAARDIWLAAAPAHAAAYRKAERVWRMTGELDPMATVPPAAARRGMTRPAPAAALVALAACLLLAVLPLLRPDLVAGLMAQVATGRAEVRAVALDDGSRVHLDALSAMSADYGDGRRSVILHHGEAFFDVVPDAARPFTVAADGLAVSVLGTSFSVRVGPDEASVAVRSGAVSVRPADGAEAVSLAPGDRLVIDRRNLGVQRHQVPVSTIAAWRDGRLIAEAVTVADVVAALRPHYKGVIVLADDALAARRVTGVLDLADPAAALRAAVRPHGGAVSEWPFVLIAGRS